MDDFSIECPDVATIDTLINNIAISFVQYTYQFYWQWVMFWEERHACNRKVHEMVFTCTEDELKHQVLSCKWCDEIWPQFHVTVPSEKFKYHGRKMLPILLRKINSYRLCERCRKKTCLSIWSVDIWRSQNVLQVNNEVLGIVYKHALCVLCNQSNIVTMLYYIGFDTLMLI